MKHHVQLSSIRFSEEPAGSGAPPGTVALSAHCTCGLAYRLGGVDVVAAAENLRTSIVRHLDEVQAQGEETSRWPF